MIGTRGQRHDDHSGAKQGTWRDILDTNSADLTLKRVWADETHMRRSQQTASQDRFSALGNTEVEFAGLTQLLQMFAVIRGYDTAHRGLGGAQLWHMSAHTGIQKEHWGKRLQRNLSNRHQTELPSSMKNPVPNTQKMS